MTSLTEINMIHDGSDVHLLEYLEMATKSGVYSSGAGFGTFGGRITGGNMVLDFTPNVGTAWFQRILHSLFCLIRNWSFIHHLPRVQTEL